MAGTENLNQWYLHLTLSDMNMKILDSWAEK
jgi:hypothetical protein